MHTQTHGQHNLRPGPQREGEETAIQPRSIAIERLLLEQHGNKLIRALRPSPKNHNAESASKKVAQ
jgi:hypothetical protein